MNIKEKTATLKLFNKIQDLKMSYIAVKNGSSSLNDIGVEIELLIEAAKELNEYRVKKSIMDKVEDFFTKLLHVDPI